MAVEKKPVKIMETVLRAGLLSEKSGGRGSRAVAGRGLC